MKAKICLSIAVIALVLICGPVKTYAQAVKKGTIKVAILYPAGEGKTFDMEYYTGKHFPLLRKLFGNAMTVTAIDKGIATSTPGAPAPYMAIGYLYFDNLKAFQEGMKLHAAEIRADIPHYTNSTPVVQISEVIE